MLYIVSGELLPEANKLYKGRMSALGNVLGFLVRNNCSKNIRKQKTSKIAIFGILEVLRFFETLN